MAEPPGSWEAWLATLDYRTWGSGLGALGLSYLGAVTLLRKTLGDVRANKAASVLAERTQLSAQAAAILAEKNADIAALRAEREELQDKLEEARAGADLIEEWCRGCIRRDYNGVLVELDGVYRILIRVIADPREERAWDQARDAVEHRRAWPDIAVPSAAELARNRLK